MLDALSSSLTVASSGLEAQSTRMRIVSETLANANTPGFKARDVEPFNKVLDTLPVRLATTSPSHMQLSAAEADTRTTSKKDSWDVVHSGNSVSLEQEMIKGNDVNRDYSMNSAIVRSFHRMVLSSAKA